ncbi:hydrogenase expression/formation protein HypE [Coprothermobacteraceae bacterium]|nr:hydrogenase expression/formation protein HypE [Coprothermobacteraceae bacterium]
MCERILLSIGSGGEEMQSFLQDVVFPAIGSEIHGDSALIGEVALTIDSFVANPPVFPGGSLGTLAVSGSVNDLVASGARPTALAVSLIVEEGTEVELIKNVLTDIRITSQRCSISVVTGDTKVVPKGAADKLFVTSAGIGKRCLAFAQPTAGDHVITTGDLGRHGAAMLIANNKYQLKTSIESDCAPLHWLIDVLKPFEGHIKWMRDPTRGGAATVLHEFAKEFRLGVRVYEERLPVQPEVRGICELLGLEVLHLPSEGQMLIVCDSAVSEDVVESIRLHSPDAAIIGEVTAEHQTVTRMVEGAETFVPMLTGEMLPRIC